MQLFAQALRQRSLLASRPLQKLDTSKGELLSRGVLSQAAVAQMGQTVSPLVKVAVAQMTSRGDQQENLEVCATLIQVPPYQLRSAGSQDLCITVGMASRSGHGKDTAATQRH